MIHNHEVPSSILGPATKKAVRFTSNCLFSFIFFASTEKSLIFAAMKQIISTIILLVLAIPAMAQDVVKLLEPAYADSAAVYRQSVYVPQKWDRRHVVLYIERPLGATHVRVNGAEAGSDSAKFVPHIYNITKHIVAGQRNQIEIAVAGHDARAMLGDVELRSQPRNLYINKVTISPKPYNAMVGVDLDLRGQSPDFGYYGLQILVQHEDKDSAAIYVANEDIWGSRMELTMRVPDQDRFWDEFHPNVFRMAVSAADDYQELTFGMREAGVVDGQLFINRRPVYLRGAVMDDYFPQWGHMPTDVATWEKIFRRLEAMGLNHVRFNGFCPVEAAFSAADKVGLYLQAEVDSQAELGRIANAFGHHPSLVLMAVGDSCYVWNNGFIVPVKLNQNIIYGTDMMQYKQGVEQRLLNDSCGHFLLGGLCDRQGDFSGVLHARWTDKDAGFAAADFQQFCRPIIPLVRFEKPSYTSSDTLRVPVVVYNAMYGHLNGVRTSYFLNTDSGQVVAGGLVASGMISLAPQNTVGEIVFPLDSVKAPCKLNLTLTVGAPSVRNHWEIEVKP